MTIVFSRRVSHITLPDGQRIELRDWVHSPLWSTMTAFVFGDRRLLEDTRIELGYTTEGFQPPPLESLTLFEYAERFGVSYWDLRCHVAEFLSRERRGLRSDRQWRQMYLHLVD